MMDVTLAGMADLPRLRTFYQAVVRQMWADQLFIWDEVYPCCALEEDIARGQLYLMEQDGELLATFALALSHPGAEQVRWAHPASPARYLDRLAGSASRRKQGLGREALRQAARLTRAWGGDYLRLFAVLENAPAVRLYQKAGFQQAGGQYHEVIDADQVLHELGFECQVSR